MTPRDTLSRFKDERAWERYRERERTKGVGCTGGRERGRGGEGGGGGEEGLRSLVLKET